MKIDFIKMQTNGSDYIYIDCFHNNVDIELVKKNIKYLCDRNFGIGSNGLILILPSEKAKAKTIIYNQDGSEATICGNGLCAAAKYLYDNKLVFDQEFKIETQSGERKINLKIKTGEVESISINMGKPSFIPQTVPVLTEKSFFLNENIVINNDVYKTTCLSMGNPHAIIFTKYINNLKLYNIGPIIESYYLFPERINVEFVEKIDENNIKMKIWERGTGETLSCGSGACAAVAAAVINNELCKDVPINVIERGGTSKVEYKDEGIILTSKPENIYKGKVLLKK